MTTTRVLAALGLWCGHALAAVRLDAQAAPPNAAADSTFLLTTDDPARSPSPFIGNGRVGVVIPPLGIGAEPSLAAGLYEHGPGDVPRIAAMPDWTGIRVFDGERWLDAAPPAHGSIQNYRQIDRHADRHGPHQLRLGGRLPAHASGGRDLRLACRAGRRGHPARARAAAGRAAARPVRARGTCATAPAPARHPPAHRAALGAGGALVSRAHDRSLAPRGLDATGCGSLALTATPEGRETVLGQAASVSWDRGIPGAAARARAAGDTAMVEIAFDAAAGRHYTFTQILGIATSAEPGQPLAVATRRVDRRGPAATTASPPTTLARGPGAGRPTS